MIQWGNVGVIGSSELFAVDLMKKTIDEALDNNIKCAFLGKKKLLESIGDYRDAEIIIIEHNIFEEEYKIDKEYFNMNIVVTSDWIHKYRYDILENIEEYFDIITDKNHKLLTFFNIMEFELDLIDKFLAIHDKLIFEDENKRQMINTKEMSNIKFLLKSIKKSKIDNLDLQKNKKNLETLNNSIINFSFESDVEKVIKTAIETVLEMTDADYGSITVLFSSNKIEKEYSYSNIDMTYSYRIHCNGEIVGILTLGYRENYNKGKADEYIIDVICKSLGDIIYAIREKEEGKLLKKTDKRIRYTGELAGGIVHDLNNIFSIIKGYTQLLGINKQAYNIKEYIKIIEDGANEAIDKVKTLQDFSRNIKEDKKYVLINDIIKKAIKTTRPKWENMTYIKGRNIDIILNLKSEKTVFVQESDIRESIVNMILNSVDSMEEGGNICINTYDIDDEVFIEIMDEGKGMDKEILDKIFEPFFTTKQKSTGLGLSVVKKNVEANEGNIEATSIKGQMSKFEIRLPIREENAECYA
ncbi:sensor histidine kinase [Tepidibacter aestuarii]|uniref:sensor histidine kinase n=1 Tax=Tepidibacter aestuarii TaxID=2925782 RepID=UPI0020C07103|nr:ATP-binding protein [Tepidibacter aestuarii]CAH2211917.1 Histidine kinase [Tepidibacter aestuarii]